MLLSWFSYFGYSYVHLIEHYAHRIENYDHEVLIMLLLKLINKERGCISLGVFNR
jgi:hypothetical protein